MDKIDSFRGKFRFLSNFYPCAITFDGLTYASSEAAFHAQKCARREDKIQYTLLKNPIRAKQLGRRETLPDNWDDVRHEVMAAILRVKFADPVLADKLNDTGDAYLEEGNQWHDNFWGNCSCERCRDRVGENRLGRILMDIRAEHRCA